MPTSLSLHNDEGLLFDGHSSPPIYFTSPAIIFIFFFSFSSISELFFGCKQVRLGRLFFPLQQNTSFSWLIKKNCRLIHTKIFLCTNQSAIFLINSKTTCFEVEKKFHLISTINSGKPHQIFYHEIVTDDVFWKSPQSLELFILYVWEFVIYFKKSLKFRYFLVYLKVRVIFEQISKVQTISWYFLYALVSKLSDLILFKVVLSSFKTFSLKWHMHQWDIYMKIWNLLQFILNYRLYISLLIFSLVFSII